MEFRLLGPLEVIEENLSAPLGGPKQRVVLAHLLLEANHVVTVERLIDALWDDDPPASARNTLQTYIKHLRKVLGPDAIEHVSSGYTLRVDPSAVDALRFESMVEASRRVAGTDGPRAALDLREALGLWRGPALDDLSTQPSLAAERARLDEMRLAALEDRIAVDLDLGRHRELIPELETLIARHPYRERSWGSLMLALYRAGRQGEALAAFQRAREVLLDELGIDPSPDLQRLQEQILKQDAALETGGDALRGYRLLEQLGEGAFGAVYRAFQPEVGREVAVKIVHPRLANHPEFIRRFAAEAQLVARLEHPHIVPLYDYWREPEGAYLVMRYLRGGSLRQRIADGPLDLDVAVSVIDQIALALGAAHRQGVIHRDVQPANVLFDEEGNAYLTDFGIAMDLSATATSPMGGGTFAYYQSPEEARGEPITHRTDLYSLGLVLYESLTGRHALSEDHADSVPPIAAIRDDLPDALDDVIARATALEPTDRFADAVAFSDALHAALVAAPRGSSRAELRNPFKGLRAFEEADARDFFGREVAVDELAARLREVRFLAVVGPSGSGKSSIVRAGLVPELCEGAAPRSERWFVVDVIPGARPFDELAAGLARIAARPRSGDPERLRIDRDGLARIVDEILPDGAELVVVIDQFEELFTLVEDAEVRAAFLAMLAAAATDPAERIRVVVTIRADFYDRPLLYRGFGDLIAENTYAVTPLSASEIEAAIVGPAASVGVTVAPGLVSEIVADVADRPGALPLFQFAMTALFEASPDAVLTPETYRDLGGVSGALARSAEHLYERLEPVGKEAARQLFLRLVDVDEGSATDTRRRVARSEMLSLDVEPDAMQAATDAFGARRLLSFDRDPVTRGPTVEVAHEALLREWTRLRRWIESAREDLRTEQRLATATAEWEEQGRDPGSLLRGPRLDQIESWAASTELAIGRLEREYLNASLDERDRALATELARRDHEAQLERRSVRRLRGLLAVLSAAALVAASLTLVATEQRERAGREALLARARELVAASRSFLETDPDRSILLAIEAVELSRSEDRTVLLEAEAALHEAVTGSRAVLTVPGVGGALSWSPSGIFVTEGPEDSGMIETRNDVTGEPVLSFRGHDGDVTDVEFTTDGSMLATTGDDGQLKVWNPTSGDLVSLVAGTGPALGLSFSADGSRVAAVWPDEEVVRVADPNTGEVERELRIPMVYEFGTALSPDGSRLAFAAGGPLIVIDLATGSRVEQAEPHWGAGAPSWSPNGNYITLRGDWGIWLLDAMDGDHLDRVQGVGGEVAWSPDSRRFAATRANSIVVFSILEGGAVERTLTLVGGEMRSQPEGLAEGLAFSSDGRAVMVGDEHLSAVKIWDLGPRNAEWASIRTRHNFWSDVEFLPDGELVAANSGGLDGSVKIWEIGSQRLVRRIEAGSEGAHFREPLFDVSPDGELVAINADGSLRVLDTSTGEEAEPMRREGVVAADWSPDGELLVAAGAHGSVSIVDRSGQVIQTLQTGWETAFDARFGPDGRLVAVSNDDGDPQGEQTWIWDWGRDDVITRILDNAYEIAWDPSGSRIVTDGTVWDVRSGEKKLVLPYGIRFAFSPGGSRIARASTDGVDLFDARTGEQLFALQGDCPAAGIDFSPDGDRLVSVDACDTIRVWAYSIDNLLEVARAEVTRSLTDDECRTYLHLESCP